MSDTCKLVFFLAVAAVIPFRAAWGQSAPAQTKPAESATAAAEAGTCGPCSNEPCDDEPRSSWMSSRPLCSLFDRLKPDCGPVPWANWSEHPLSIGCFAGMMNGGPLIADWVGTSTGFDGGWRLGWEVSPNWAAESRLAFASLKLYDGKSAVAAIEAIDKTSGLPFTVTHRNAELFQWDVDILYYPWGETRLRPYFLTGAGLTNVYFRDLVDQDYQITCLSLPLGLGVKYLCSEQLSVRLDLLDDIALSSNHLQTQQNLSLTAGVELRFGGSRKVYWPWDLGREFW